MPPVYFHFNGRTLEVHARSIKAAGAIVAVALAIHDVTELQHLSRARRDFVTNISHELRNPIASLKLLTETLLNGGLDDKEAALEMISNTDPFEVTGHPACRVPAGLANGLPTGMMIIGKRFDDATVLRVAAACERAVGGFPALSS